VLFSCVSGPVIFWKCCTIVLKGIANIGGLGDKQHKTKEDLFAMTKNKTAQSVLFFFQAEIPLTFCIHKISTTRTNLARSTCWMR
jgi:hypothetical protein